ncbi:hypothetical protein ACJX0J_005850, partial [Zea mays]
IYSKDYMSEEFIERVQKQHILLPILGHTICCLPLQQFQCATQLLFNGVMLPSNICTKFFLIFFFTHYSIHKETTPLRDKVIILVFIIVLLLIRDRIGVFYFFQGKLVYFLNRDVSCLYMMRSPTVVYKIIYIR